MYINYSDGREINMRTKLRIFIQDDTLIQEVEFPDEPKANYTSRIELKKNKGFFGDEEVVDLNLQDGNVARLSTKFKGKDDNKKADIYKTYVFGERNLSITKTVIFQKSGEKLIRNRFTYNKQ